MTENIITQVSDEPYTNDLSQGVYDDSNSNIDYNSKIHLNIRGSEFTITRDELMSLPESILLCLFPNGVFLDAEGQVITNLTEGDIVFVNFDPQCFEYIINTFSDAQKDLQDLAPVASQTSVYNRHQQDSASQILQNKPAIIVLREDMDFYIIPPVAGLTEAQIKTIKTSVGSMLVKNELIFSGLGFDATLPPGTHQDLGPAEKHLFDMLCSSGFEHQEVWGNRSIEPGKCIILSLLLVRLRNDPPTAPDSPNLLPVTSNASTGSRSRSRSRFANLANSASRAASRSLSRVKKPTESHTKLLLFWRKPARKCWWSNEELDLELEKLFDNQKDPVTIKVHIRRVWTLELSVIGVQ